MAALSPPRLPTSQARVHKRRRNTLVSTARPFYFRASIAPRHRRRYTGLSIIRVISFDPRPAVFIADRSVSILGLRRLISAKRSESCEGTLRFQRCIAMLEISYFLVYMPPVGSLLSASKTTGSFRDFNTAKLSFWFASYLAEEFIVKDVREFCSYKISFLAFGTVD